MVRSFYKHWQTLTILVNLYAPPYNDSVFQSSRFVRPNNIVHKPEVLPGVVMKQSVFSWEKLLDLIFNFYPCDT